MTLFFTLNSEKHRLDVGPYIGYEKLREKFKCHPHGVEKIIVADNSSVITMVGFDNSSYTTQVDIVKGRPSIRTFKERAGSIETYVRVHLHSGDEVSIVSQDQIMTASMPKVRSRGRR